MLKKIIKSKLPGVVLMSDICKNYIGSKMNPDDYPKYLEKWYKRYTGETMDISNPINYTQKIQWLKLNDSTQLKADLSDKYKVRVWVKEKIGEEYLVPVIAEGIKDANDIDFDSLPRRFVIKTNHGSGWNIIVKDKNKLNKKKTIKTLNTWLKLDFAYKSGLELHYKLIDPCLIIEEYMENIDGELNDYKFLCFNGKPYYCWVDLGRYSDHRRNVYNMNWELQPWQQHTYEQSKEIIHKPKNFNKMIELATKLCEGFSHVRVDFYNINGKILFGEMTFTNGSGRELIYPAEENIKLGNLIDIEEIKNKKEQQK